MKDYCYRKIRKKFRVFPSRYAGFALARCRRGLRGNASKSPELMSVAEFKKAVHKGVIHQATGVILPGENKAKSSLEIGEINGYSPADIARFYAFRYTNFGFANRFKRIPQDAIKRGHIQLLKEAHYLGRKINKEALKDLMSKSIRSNPIPPRSVARVAKKALLKRKKYHRGGTFVGIARARDLSRRVNVSMSTVRRMSSYFARHRASRLESIRRRSDPTSAAAIADELWGGTPGLKWARKVLKSRKF